MTSRKFLQVITLSLLITALVPVSSAAGTGDPVPLANNTKTEDPRAQQLLTRLHDIKNMDKSSLTGSEKKTLRKEVKGIRKEMKEIKGGVYLSVGAILIVILLLILIL
ncbi:MAG: hypothetical protein HZA79_13605 [Sphingobacteriales bacterium]|nr:hypothetical protein [Sphingobacteriales bacterium]